MSKIIEQTIKNVDLESGVAWVTSKRGKTYSVELSDEVRLKKNPQKDDIGVIKIIGSRWIMIDVISRLPMELMVKQDPNEWDIILGGY